MAIEIEKKFLLISDHWRQLVHQSKRIKQAYLGGDFSSVRVRITDQSANLNIKSLNKGLSRQEYEYPIPLSDAEEIFASLCGSNWIDKTRHLVSYAGKLWEIDEFHGLNAGLIVAEVEMEAENEQFELPDWADKEVTHEARYYNIYLVKHPFSTWSHA